MNDAEFYRYVIHLNWTNRLGSQPLKHRPRPPRLHEIEEPRADHLDFCILYLLNSNEKQQCDTLIWKTKIKNCHDYLGAILNWVAKVVWNFLGFALLRFLIGPELSPLFKPIRCKSKTKHNLVTRVYPCFPALYAFLVVSSLSFHWLLGVFFFLPVGRSELKIALAYCFWKLILPVSSHMSLAKETKRYVNFTWVHLCIFL